MGKASQISKEETLDLSNYSRAKCFNCNKLPTVDILWANGKGRCWFCAEHFELWKKEKNEMSKTGTNEGDINKVYKVKNGKVPKKWSDWNNLGLTKEDVRAITKKKIYGTKKRKRSKKKCKDMSDLELEYWHIFTHKENDCSYHREVVEEMMERGFPHYVRELCDEVVELIKNWKTYNPKNIAGNVLRDDFRIVNAWIKNILNKGKKMQSSQFKEYSLEQQKRIVKALKDKIRKEMIRRGWKSS